MKKLFFISFFAVVIISAIICIATGFQARTIIPLIASFIIGLAVTLGILHNHYIGEREDKDYNLGGLIGIGIGIGSILALVGGFLLHSWLGNKVTIFLFLGPVLGSLIGYMYPFKDKNLKAET